MLMMNKGFIGPPGGIWISPQNGSYPDLLNHLFDFTAMPPIAQIDSMVTVPDTPRPITRAALSTGGRAKSANSYQFFGLDL